jgi:hypothetical protein
MKIKTLFIIFFLLICNLLYSLNNYPGELAGIIKRGKNQNEIGLSRSAPPREYFTLAPNGNIYIFDKRYGKIKIFTHDFIFVDEMYVRDYMIYAIYSMKISNNGDIYIYDGSGFKKITNDKKLAYAIEYRDLPDELKHSYNYWPYGDIVFFYDDSNRENLKIRHIDATGVMRNEEETTQLLNEVNVTIQTRNFNEALLKDKTDAFKQNTLKKHELLVLKDKVLTTSGSVLEKYFTYLRENIDLQKTNKDLINDLKKGDFDFIGYDKEHNTYMENYCGFYVFNKYGVLLDAFKHVQEGINPVAISPDGELFYWERDEEEIRFYKITRRW